MNSKEALTQLTNELKFVYGKDLTGKQQKNIEAIKKDLQVLEIIKKHKLLNYVIKNPKCANMYHLTEEETIKLKELEK